MTHQTTAFVGGRGGAGTRIEVCCSLFALAMQSGTDNEGYGPLIGLDDFAGKIDWAMGVGLPQPFHCPWCGAVTEVKEIK